MRLLLHVGGSRLRSPDVHLVQDAVNSGRDCVPQDQWRHGSHVQESSTGRRSDPEAVWHPVGFRGNFKGAEGEEIVITTRVVGALSDGKLRAASHLTFTQDIFQVEHWYGQVGDDWDVVQGAYRTLPGMFR